MVEGHVSARTCWFDSSPGHRRITGPHRHGTVRKVTRMGRLPSFITRCGIDPTQYATGRSRRVAHLFRGGGIGPPAASGRRLGRWGRLSAFAVLLAALAGCRALKSGPGADAVTQSDRLMATYPDLQTGRFTVIADFEQTRHMELFRSVSTAGTALHRLSLTSGVPATGISRGTGATTICWSCACTRRRPWICDSR